MMKMLIARHRMTFTVRRAPFRKRLRFIRRHWRALGLSGVWMILRRGRGGVRYSSDGEFQGAFYV